jgi:hypothetical protein
MRGALKIWFVLLLGILIWSSGLLAHHGAAGQDMTKLTTVKGAVTDFQFINPHVLLYLDVKDESGKIEKWVGELNGPNEMTRQHMNKNTLKPGDQITVVGNRSKNGSNFLRVHSFVTPSGQEFVLARGVDYLPKESDK